jgi:hypothetical protein
MSDLPIREDEGNFAFEMCRQRLIWKVAFLSIGCRQNVEMLLFNHAPGRKTAKRAHSSQLYRIAHLLSQGFRLAMNLDHLGDALDHWKGSLLEGMQCENLLDGLAADAMATGAPKDWIPEDLGFYATLLRLEQRQILKHTVQLQTDRAQYFREIADHSADLFLDPDIGIATSHVAHEWRYLKPKELHNLLDAARSRVVAVYQHIRGITPLERLRKIMSVLSDKAQPFCCCSYESSTVAMLFFSSNSSRIEVIHKHHTTFLGRHAANRTHIWHY